MIAVDRSRLRFLYPGTFSSPEAALLLVSTKNRDFEDRGSQRSNDRARARGSRSRFLVLTKRSAASGDENDPGIPGCLFYVSNFADSRAERGAKTSIKSVLLHNITFFQQQ